LAEKAPYFLFLEYCRGSQAEVKALGLEAKGHGIR